MYYANTMSLILFLLFCFFFLQCSSFLLSFLPLRKEAVLNGLGPRILYCPTGVWCTGVWCTPRICSHTWPLFLYATPLSRITEKRSGSYEIIPSYSLLDQTHMQKLLRLHFKKAQRLKSQCWRTATQSHADRQTAHRYQRLGIRKQTKTKRR